MKVKITENGNVKITLTREQSQHLKSILLEAWGLASDEKISQVSQGIASEICSRFDGLSISYKH